MGTTTNSGKNGIGVVTISIDPVPLQVSPDGLPSTNDNVLEDTYGE